MVKSLIKQICPPVILNLFRSFRKKNEGKPGKDDLPKTIMDHPENQDLDLYWTPEMAKILDEWGTGNVWNEIQLLLASCKGKVLDIACGTGKTIELLKKFTNLEIYGCDISDLLIKKGIERGIEPNKLLVCDATKTSYFDNEFDYSYSIGSLEHFTLGGIDAFIQESHRITSKASFHMIPTSRSQSNQGWIKTTQSYFNNSEGWWYQKFKKYYSSVYIIPSKWEDDISYGIWCVCIKDIQ